MSVTILADKQNRDGGWPYARGGSWTEPTAYAVLALFAAGEKEPAERGVRWLQAVRRPDGGWPPQPGIDQSTWVTALVALLPPEHLGQSVHAGAIRWLMGMAGAESAATYRLREWLLGHAPLAGEDPPGWPWVPGTAAWVAPTGLAILALEAEYRRNPRPDLKLRIGAGRQFLLHRVCQGGGWNHGSTHALGYPSTPYPEVTGLALAALRGVRSPQVETSIALARSYLTQCRSADAWNWLRLGLLVHGQLPAESEASSGLSRRTLPETALDLMVTASIQRRDGFLV